MKTLAMTHTDALELLRVMGNFGADAGGIELLTDAIAFAEESAICDDVFIDLSDDGPDAETVHLAAVLLDIQRKVF